MRASARLSVRPISEDDQAVYQQVLPEKSLLLDALEFLPWDQFADKLKAYYADNNEGQPEYPPLILLKIELLCHLYGLGRAKAIERATSDLHWKYFLGLPIRATLPDQSTLCVFRQRLGTEGFKGVFDALLGAARDEGLISDRLRLKDATHIYGDVAIPTSLGLFASLRDRMLAAIRRFDPAAADVFESDIEAVREKTVALGSEGRLAARVALVEDLLAWITEQPACDETSPAGLIRQKHWQAMQSIGELAAKILFDLAHPEHGDKTQSVVDPDVRRGKHGEYYNGYMLDVMMDAESELVTALDVLPANGAEASNAVDLIASEEAAHNNDIEQLSIDGIGFNGEVLHRLTDPEGLGVEVFTPPTNFQTSDGFDSSQFELSDDGTRVRCPAGELSGVGGRKADKPNTLFFTFGKATCAGCPLLSACHPNFNPTGRSGRRVSKNRYEQDYQRARQVAQTERYSEVRRIHPAIERKLNEFVRHHGGRRTKHRGRVRVLIEQLLRATVINLKRMAKLVREKYEPATPPRPAIA